MSPLLADMNLDGRKRAFDRNKRELDEQRQKGASRIQTEFSQNAKNLSICPCVFPIYKLDAAACDLSL